MEETETTRAGGDNRAVKRIHGDGRANETTEETTGPSKEITEDGGDNRTAGHVKRINGRWRRQQGRQKKQRKLEETTGPSKEITEDGEDNGAVKRRRW